MQTRDIEQDLIDYIMGLWHQQRRWNMIRDGRKKHQRNAIKELK